LPASAVLRRKISLTQKIRIKPRLNNNTATEIMLAATPVKNQSMTGTCWCFGTTSMIESQCLKNNAGDIDISEMFAVRNIYIEKAKITSFDKVIRNLEKVD
jgi:aminopeptidase C